MIIVNENISHGGRQLIITHDSSACKCEMKFSVFLPPQAETKPCPVLYYLSGLTCSHANVTEKGEFRAAAAEHGIIIVCPDTSPRGENIADEEVYYFGTGAGFYVDATQEPFAENYNMYAYVTDELPAIIEKEFNADMSRQSITGHSMGGHGAMICALKNPDTYKSVSAFAPICAPTKTDWGKNAFTKYLGTDENIWRSYDSVALIEDGNFVPEILVDQGIADEFLENSIRITLLETACKDKGINLTLRMHEDYDHSYYFISSFMSDHIAWHAKHLG